MKKKYIHTLLLTVLTVTVLGQNLITNPSAELDPTTNGWTQVSGNWVSGTEVTAQDGTYHFFAGAAPGTVELYQDVDVSSFATTIDAGTQDFHFSGYIRNFNGSDEGQIIVEYRDVSSTILSTYDTGLQSPTTWTQFNDTRTAPVNTRTIRIRLLSVRNAGNDNDGYMDNLVLNAGSSLPIELINFNAVATNDKQIRLEWQTASEINNDYFSIERSIDGINWKNIKDVDGAGNSSSLLNYVFYDENPFLEISYYRLKQTDFNGQYSYSDIRVIEIDELEDSKIELYPNPANYQITLTGNEIELKRLKIYNTYGEDVTVLTKFISSNSSKLIIDLSNLNTGMYYIKTKTTTNKVHKQ